ncbi:SHOCT domain-containing protein [Erythrobacteraceae bacterium WH01K]|nr:SHOCT domain-containing protein [Erythrobacteraceae bacterium WH01K]
MKAKLTPLTSVLALALAVSSSPALAGPDEDLRDAARFEAKEYRNAGWPVDRCYVGITFGDGLVLTGAGDLQPGDRLTSVNSVDVTDADIPAITNAFAEAQVGGYVPVTYERDGVPASTQMLCGNLADEQTRILDALDYAGKKDWYDCIDALEGLTDRYAVNLKIRCASVSRKRDDYPIRQWTDGLARDVISSADIATSLREEAAKSLRNARFNLSGAVYADLLSTVQSWDDGAVWDSVKPDHALLSEAARQAIRNRLIDPSSAIIEMPYGFVFGEWKSWIAGTHTGFITCGYVNAKNRMGGYVGQTAFVAVVTEAGLPVFADMDKANSSLGLVNSQCNKTIPMLPPAPFEEPAEADPTPVIIKEGPSLADELAELADLHAAGVLTDAEYAEAKAKVIAGD